MMRLSERLPYLKGEGFEAITLPYGEGDYRFYLFLPDKGRTEVLTLAGEPLDLLAWLSQVEVVGERWVLEGQQARLSVRFDGGLEAVVGLFGSCLQTCRVGKRRATFQLILKQEGLT